MSNPVVVDSPNIEEYYEYFRVDLLDRYDNDLNLTLGMVKSGVVDYSIFNTIRSGGNVEIITHRDATKVNWMDSRVKVYYVRDVSPVFTSDGGYTQSQRFERPLGVFITSTPSYNYSETEISAKVELYDKLIIPSLDSHANTYTVEKNTNLLEAAKVVLESCGVGRHEMSVDTSSTTSLPDAMVWEAGTTKLQIINDILDAIGFFSLWVDVHGKFKFTRWEEPSRRPKAYSFRDDNSSIYLNDFTLEEDFYDIPNHVVAISNTTGEKPALVYVATLPDSHPFSYSKRGRKIVRVERGVKIPDGPEGEADIDRERRTYDILKQHAHRVLNEGARRGRVITIKHLYIQNLALNNHVTFLNDTHGIPLRDYTVTNMSIPLTVGGLVTTTLREIIDEGFDTVE